MPTLAETLAAGADELAEFNALLAQYLDALAAMQANVVNYTLYVSPSGGDDTNDGLTVATAKETLAGALALTPRGSYVRIYLLGNYTMEADISTEGRVIRIIGVDASLNSVQRQLIQTVSGGVARHLACNAGGAFQLINVDVMLTKTTISSGAAALVTGLLQTLTLQNCGVDVETGVTTSSLMNSAGISILEVTSVTALDDAIAGKWILGVSASTNPNTLGKVLTNLATL